MSLVSYDSSPGDLSPTSTLVTSYLPVQSPGLVDMDVDVDGSHLY